MKFPKQTTSRAVAALFSVAALLCTSCHSPPKRQLNLPNAGAEEETTPSEYVQSYINSPEMFPRERDLLDRRQELLINFATQQALDNDRARVRAIAPLLQLSGDEATDRSRRYTVTLVADDISGTNTFLNEYEVRVGPDPAIAVVAPAATAPNLASVDLLLAQEKQEALQLDNVMLRADTTFSQTYLTNFGSQLTNMMQSANSNQVSLQSLASNLDLQLQTNSTTFAQAITSLIGLTNHDQIEKTNALLLSLSQARVSLQSQMSSAQNLAATEAGQAQKLESLNRQTGVMQSALAWNQTQLSFWNLQASNLTEAAKIGPFYTANTTNTAVSVIFRPISLKQIDKITIDVIRKIPKGPRTNTTDSDSLVGLQQQQEESKQNSADRINSLIGVLRDLDTTFLESRKVLNIQDPSVDTNSQMGLIHYYSAQFPSKLGQIKALQQEFKALQQQLHAAAADLAVNDALVAPKVSEAKTKVSETREWIVSQEVAAAETLADHKPPPAQERKAGTLPPPTPTNSTPTTPGQSNPATTNASIANAIEAASKKIAAAITDAAKQWIAQVREEHTNVVATTAQTNLLSKGSPVYGEEGYTSEENGTVKSPTASSSFPPTTSEAIEDALERTDAAQSAVNAMEIEVAAAWKEAKAAEPDAGVKVAAENKAAGETAVEKARDAVEKAEDATADVEKKAAEIAVEENVAAETASSLDSIVLVSQSTAREIDQPGILRDAILRNSVAVAIGDVRLNIQVALAKLNDGNFSATLSDGADEVNGLQDKIDQKRNSDLRLGIAFATNFIRTSTISLRQLCASLYEMRKEIANLNLVLSSHLIPDDLSLFYQQFPSFQRDFLQFKQQLPPQDLAQKLSYTIMSATAFSPTNRMDNLISLTNASSRALVLASLTEVDASVTNLLNEILFADTDSLTNFPYTTNWNPGVFTNAIRLSEFTKITNILIQIQKGSELINSNIYYEQQKPQWAAQTNVNLQTIYLRLIEHLGRVQSIRDYLKRDTEAYAHLNDTIISLSSITSARQNPGLGVQAVNLDRLDRDSQEVAYLINRLNVNDITNQPNPPALSPLSFKAVSLEVIPAEASSTTNVTGNPVLIRLDDLLVLSTTLGQLAETNEVVVTNLSGISPLLSDKTFKIEVQLNPGSPTNVVNATGTNQLVLTVDDRLVLKETVTNLNTYLRFGSTGGDPVFATSPPTLPPASPDIYGTVARITNGDEAIFRINVLRGIVSTTAFLVPDDGVKELFGKHFADEFYVAQVTLSNPNQQPILIYGTTLRLVVRMTAASPDELGEDGFPTRKNWWATYQPMDYNSVLAMLQRSNSNDWRALTAKYIQYATVLTGFGALYTTSVDLARGIALLSGTVNPATQALLLADLNAHEQEFQKVGLNPFEEIQPGASITRYLFLPKGPIFGDYAYDPALASKMNANADNVAQTFSRQILRPTFIYNIRREEAYVEGKRILASDALSPSGGK